MTRHRFHGDEKRFEVVAAFVSEHFGHSVKYIADVAGGQGMLTRILRKRYNYECEVIDPRGWTLNGVPARKEYFDSEMAAFYDLVIGLHPDQALPSVVEAGVIRPTVVIPCCNFFDPAQRLGRNELLTAIEQRLRGPEVDVQRFDLTFLGPFNVALVTTPRGADLDQSVMSSSCNPTRGSRVLSGGSAHCGKYSPGQVSAPRKRVTG